MSKIKRYFSCALFSAALILIAVKPEPYLGAAYRGWELFVGSVMPSLVPFAFATSFMTLSGSAEILFKLLSKPAKRLFSTTGAGGYVFAVSLISGYPIGAKTISELKKCGCIDDGALMKLLGDFRAGALIMLAHVLGSVINGAVFGRLNKPAYSFSEVKSSERLNAVKAFREALGNTVSAALTVAACMILFNVAIQLLSETGIVNIAGRAAEALGIPAGAGEGFVAGFVEITYGIKSLAGGLPIKQTVPLIAALVSFGGMSVQMQSMFFLGEAGVKGSTFFSLKVAQTIFTYAAASAVAAIFL